MKNKLIKLEKYIKRTNFNYPNAKKNMLFRFHEIFFEELKNTESGIKFRKKIGVL